MNPNPLVFLECIVLFSVKILLVLVHLNHHWRSSLSLTCYWEEVVATYLPD